MGLRSEYKTPTRQIYSSNQNSYLRFIKRLLLVSLILLNLTADVEAANFVSYRNPNSGVTAFAPAGWYMPEQLFRDNFTTTLLRILSPDARTHLEVLIFNEYLPVKTLSELSQNQINDLARDMINSHLSMFKGSELIYFNKNANYNGIPSIIYIFRMNQGNEDLRFYIHSFIYNHHSYSIKFFNRVPGDLSPEELERIVNSVRI